MRATRRSATDVAPARLVLADAGGRVGGAYPITREPAGRAVRFNAYAAHARSCDRALFLPLLAEDRDR